MVVYRCRGWPNAKRQYSKYTNYTTNEMFTIVKERGVHISASLDWVWATDIWQTLKH